MPHCYELFLDVLIRGVMVLTPLVAKITLIRYNEQIFKHRNYLTGGCSLAIFSHPRYLYNFTKENSVFSWRKLVCIASLSSFYFHIIFIILNIPTNLFIFIIVNINVIHVILILFVICFSLFHFALIFIACEYCQTPLQTYRSNPNSVGRKKSFKKWNNSLTKAWIFMKF